MKNILKKEQGITLVALVTTIIILLILSGITIGSLTSKKGLINEANQSSENAQKESIIEKIEADLYSEKTITGKTPSYTKLVEIAGKYGNKKEGENVLEIKDADYSINFNEIQGWTIHYIAEAKLTDFIFDKNTILEDSFGNFVTVPNGFKISSDSAENVTEGIVIKDAKYENTKESEFVWIPVGNIKYVEGGISKTQNITLGRYNFANNGAESTYTGAFIEEDSTNTQALKNYGNTIAKNINEFINNSKNTGGYYIGRYEARKNSSEKLTEITTDNIWNEITQLNAANKSQNMYLENIYFESDLINSYAWDTAIVFFQKFGESNYSRKTSVNQNAINSGKNESVCNVYDMAGNCREWTTETSNDATKPCVRRGGGADSQASYTCYRANKSVTNAQGVDGFRPILYIK